VSQNASQNLALFDYEGRVIAPKAPAGVKRAGVVGGRLDPALLAWAARHVGQEVPKAQLWVEINAEVTCEPDSPRRRLDALEGEGLLTLGEPSRVGHVLVTWVRT
jgi:hypothetical protein